MKDNVVVGVHVRAVAANVNLPVLDHGPIDQLVRKVIPARPTAAQTALMDLTSADETMFSSRVIHVILRKSSTRMQLMLTIRDKVHRRGGGQWDDNSRQGICRDVRIARRINTDTCSARVGRKERSIRTFTGKHTEDARLNDGIDELDEDISERGVVKPSTNFFGGERVLQPENHMDVQGTTMLALHAFKESTRGAEDPINLGRAGVTLGLYKLPTKQMRKEAMDNVLEGFCSGVGISKTSANLISTRKVILNQIQVNVQTSVVRREGVSQVVRADSDVQTRRGMRETIMLRSILQLLIF